MQPSNREEGKGVYELSPATGSCRVKGRKNMQQATNNLGMQTRSAKRVETRIYGNIRYYNQSVEGRVVDLSATGMALELGGPFSAAKGSRVRVESKDLGFLEGTVMWTRGSRIGLKLQLSTNSLAQVSSYFRFFHAEPKSTFMPG